MSRLPTKPIVSQAVMDLATDDERARVAEEEQTEWMRQHKLKTELFNAIKVATIAMGGTKVVAGRLDDVWGKNEHGEAVEKGCVGESRYRAAIKEENYNTPRIEWLIELALDPHVADVLRRIADGRDELSAEEECANWRAMARERYPKDAAALEREATTRRKRRTR